MNKSSLVKATVAAVVGLGVAMVMNPALAAKEKMVKCYGIAKAHNNDCGTAKHACAAQATQSRAGGEWIYLPAGTCKKIAGASLKPVKNGAKKMMKLKKPDNS